MIQKLTLILKPTLLCNCSCKYCITPNEIPRERMKLETFEELCKKVSSSSKHQFFYFLWHGGEPLLMGREFYESCIAIQKKYFDKSKMLNTFQSNCTLIDDQWIEWLKEQKIRISTSLDGNRELHNVNRIKNSKGTFDETFEKIQLLKSNNLLNGVVTVLSKTNINHLDEIIEFFATNGINPRLNPILPSELVVSSSDDLSVSPDEWANALIQCFDKWFHSKYSNNDKISIAPFTEIVYNFFNQEQPRLCNFSGNCSNSFLAMNPVGDLFNCGRFCDIDEFNIANIFDNISLEELFERKAKLIEWDLANDDCKNCEWLRICNRGCPNTSYLFDKKIKNKDPYCEAYKKLFAHLYKHIQSELKNINANE